MSDTPATQSGPQSTLLTSTGAAARAADVLLRVAGGRSVILRLPAPAVPADPSEQLGLATPQFQDVLLGPVVFRRARALATPGKPARSELLVSASVVTRLAGTQSYVSASAFFASAFGVLCGDEFFEILSFTEEQVFGQPYVYRLVLRAPQNEIV